MDESRNQRSAHRLGFMVPLVLFVLFFVACCGVLACVFLRSASVSAQAGDYNAGVQLCRNEAERYRALVAAEEAFPEKLYFDGSFRQVQPGDAAYYITVTERKIPETAGTIRSGTITAYTLDDTQLYTLDVAVYLPDGR